MWTTVAGGIQYPGGNVNITGAGAQYMVNGVPIGAASQTPWLQDINAAGFRLLSAGNVGIGTASPQEPLSVNGTIGITSNIGNRISGSVLEMYYVATTQTGVVDVWDYSASVYRRLRLDGSPLTLNQAGAGNVGIGTANPAGSLDVLGPSTGGAGQNARIKSTDANCWLNLDTTGTTGQSGLEYYINGTWVAEISYRLTGGMAFWTQNLGSAPAITITPTGNVGIGTTGPPALLTVLGPGNDAQLHLVGTNATKSAGLYVGANVGDPTQGGFAIIRRNASTGAWEANLFIVNLANGYVGIGTTSPQALLNLFGSSATLRIDAPEGTYPAIDLGVPSGRYQIYRDPGTGFLTLFGTQSGYSGFRFYVNAGASEVLHIANSSCVGINYSSPNDSLVISGMAGGGMGQIRMAYGNYGVFFRNDGGSFYLMTTNAGDPFGTWRWPYPFQIDLPTLCVGIRASPNASYGLNVDSLNTGGLYINGVPVTSMGAHWTSYDPAVNTSVNWSYGWYLIQGNLCFLSVMFNTAASPPTTLTFNLPAAVAGGVYTSLPMYGAGPPGNVVTTANASFNSGATSSIVPMTGFQLGAGYTFVLSGAYRIS